MNHREEACLPELQAAIAKAEEADGCDLMTLREFLSALDWLEHIKGPSSKVDRPKCLAAIHADSLINEFSEKPPNSGNKAREIAGLLYEALTGDGEAELKHQTLAVRRSWRRLNLKPKARGR
jgi:hypothetical protein